MLLFEADHRVIRKDSHGNKWEYSDSEEQPSGEGWRRVNPSEHPRATKYLWTRPYTPHALGFKQQTPKTSLLDTNDIKLEPVDGALLDRLGISVHNTLADLRQKFKSGVNEHGLDHYTGDRVTLKNTKGTFYIKKVNPVNGKLHIVNALDSSDERIVSTKDVINQENPAGNSFWTKNDTVIIAPGIIGNSSFSGDVIGFDDQTNKVRIAITGGKEIEVYPEAIIGLKGNNAESLKKADKFLDARPTVLNSQDSKDLIESLLRASLQNRSSVSVNELYDDIKATTGRVLPKGYIRAQLGVIESILKVRSHAGFIFNPLSDSVYIADSRLGIRLIANKRDVKPKHKIFGWKNLTKDDSKETYASAGQSVLFKNAVTNEQGEPILAGRIKRIMGNKAEVVFRGGSRVFYLGKLTSLDHKELLPDPTDPEAYGAINRSAFWLLRDREWCRDFKKGDAVRLLSTVEDPSGKQAHYGEFGVVIDHTTDGRIVLQMNNGKRLNVSPRQLKQVREVNDTKQFKDKVLYNPDQVYGSTTHLKEDESESNVRISVGGERRNKMLHLSFSNGEEYKKLEGRLFTAIQDNRATQNQTRAIIPANKDVFPDGAMKTLVPNKDLLQSIRKLYPNAKTLMITRKMRVLPNMKTSFLRPEVPPLMNQYTPDEIRELVKKGQKPGAYSYWDPHNVQKGMRKRTKGDRDFYEPEHIAYDVDTQELSVKGGAPEDVLNKNEKFSYLHPFSNNHETIRTLQYSTPEIEGDYLKVPVSVNIIINPTKADVRNNPNGVIHELPYIIRQTLTPEERQRLDSTAEKKEDINWDNRVLLNSDGKHLYLTAGMDVMSQTSPAFRDTYGRPMTLEAVLKMPLSDKYMAWEKDPHFADKLEMTSLFTYDSSHKRFVTSLKNYREAQSFLRHFLGDSYYKSFVYEDLDGAYVRKASKESLKKDYLDYMKTRVIPTITKNDDTPLGLQGFRGKRLRPYQNEAINFMLDRNASLLASDQGTGKTAAMLGAAIGRINRDGVKRVLVIAPASVAQNTWPEEINNWCKSQKDVNKINNTKGLSKEQKERLIARLPLSVKPMVLSSATKKSFFQNLANENQPVIATTGYEMARIYGKELQQMNFDMVMLDEAQNIKTGKSKGVAGSKQAQVIKDVFEDVPYKVAATGTPLENKAADLHSIVSWLNPSLLGSAEEFSQDFIEQNYVKQGNKKILVNVAVKNAPELNARLDTIMYRKSKNALEASEQSRIKAELAKKGIKYNPFEDYGLVTPRMAYPLVSNRVDLSTGALHYLPLSSDNYLFNPELKSFGSNKDNLLNPIDLSTPEMNQKYSKYIAAVRKVRESVASQIKALKMKHTRYGNINIAASGAFIKLEKVLDDPSLLANDPVLGQDPLFRDPNMPNPKYDRLKDILKLHDKKPFDPATKSLVVADPINAEAIKKRRTALATRGKTIIFCNQVSTMKMLKNRLESDPSFKGRITFFAGSSVESDLLGKKGGGKKLRAQALKDIQTNPNVDILIANKAASTGLNIPQADLVINYEIPWNPQEKNQRIDRAHRIGSQPRPVTAVDLITKGTVEEKKLRAQVIKRQIFDSIINRQEQNAHLSADYFRQAAKFQGADKVGLLDELIQEDPTLRNVSAASEQDMARSARAKRLQIMAKNSKVKREQFRRKHRIISRMFGL